MTQKHGERTYWTQEIAAKRLKMRLKIDSREQKPYQFELDFGDYPVDGLEHAIAIEQKSLPDLIQSLSRERERFEKELFRGLSLRYFSLVIEASLAEISSGNYRSQMNPRAAVQSLITFSISD